MKFALIRLVPLASALAMAGGVSAQSTDTDLVRPVPLTQPGKFSPGFGSESIVKARFTVKADGSVDNVKLETHLGNQFVGNMLEQTLKSWTFTPGTSGGKPVDFHNQEHTFAIRFYPDIQMPGMGGPGGGRGRGGPPPGAGGGEAPQPPDLTQMPLPPLALSPKVKDAIEKITTQVAAGEGDKALKEINKLMRSDMRTVFDFALLHELKASAHMVEEDFFEALAASRLATLSAESPQGETVFFLDDSVLIGALSRRVLLAARVRQNADAWEAYQALASRFTIPQDDPIYKVGQGVKEVLDSPEPMPLLARIIDEVWTYKPARRIFTVAEVQGKLNRIDARCERNTLKLEYQANVDWTLPDSLGACELDFVGRKGTTFTVYEFVE